ncbi:potassium channel family protein [Halorientalis litorea]|uniref:potassium channel family protein n=1 Tax=Halorientalis litorea TaxID=2931977 RepID=UPI001FF4DEF4|nr:NAD-binding protein [Halorientalis litorea]
MALGGRRVGYYVLLLFGTTAAFTLLYNFGMATWEGRPQPLYRSLEIVIQSFTTTGYGEDAGWTTLQMNVLVITMQLAGIGLILTAVDVFAVPWLRDALSPTAPETVPELSDHVVVCGFTPRTDAFVDELDAREQAYVLVEPDEETANSLHDDGYHVISGDPETADALENARIATARAVVADVADDRNASIALAATEASPGTRIVTLAEDPDLKQYHSVAGADEVLSPREVLGERLAGEVPTAVTATVEEGVSVGENIELVELTVEAGSDLCRQTVAEADLRERFGVNVIGVWRGADFETRIDPTIELEAGTRLLVAGEPPQIDPLRDATTSTVREFAAQEVIVAGYGNSGQAAYGALEHTNTDLTVLDIEDAEGVDIVGDARDPETLEAAGLETASALVLTLADDTTAVFATLIARDLNPSVHVVVRANQRDDVQKLYRAGADAVESLARISGRMLAATVFEDEDVLIYDKQVRVVRLSAPGLAGETLVSADVRAETGCTVVAVWRDGSAIIDIDPTTFTFEPGDDVVIAGTDESVTRFDSQFGGD